MTSVFGSIQARRWRIDAAAGILLTILFVEVVRITVVRLWNPSPHLNLLFSYLPVWVPLVGAAVAASCSHGSGSFSRDFGLGFRFLDLLWGLAVGLLSRVLASLVEVGTYGHSISSQPILDRPERDLWWLFGAILAPLILAPVIEEVFFRGLLLRALAQTFVRIGAPQARALSIAASGIIFALLHVLTAGSVAELLVVGLSTLLFGMGAAIIASWTGRLGGAIIAHVTFNALVLIPALV